LLCTSGTTGKPKGIVRDILPVKHGSPTVPMPGYDVQILDAEGSEVAAPVDGQWRLLGNGVNMGQSAPAAPTPPAAPRPSEKTAPAGK
jgi:acyl-coenzyme A synthetase/AMP-(fatty) acid ligase